MNAFLVKPHMALLVAVLFLFLTRCSTLPKSTNDPSLSRNPASGEILQISCNSLTAPSYQLNSGGGKRNWLAGRIDGSTIAFVVKAVDGVIAPDDLCLQDINWSKKVSVSGTYEEMGTLGPTGNLIEFKFSKELQEGDLYYPVKGKFEIIYKGEVKKTVDLNCNVSRNFYSREMHCGKK